MHHVSKVVPPGLFFVRRIIDLLVAFRSPVIRFGQRRLSPGIDLVAGIVSFLGLHVHFFSHATHFLPSRSIRGLLHGRLWCHLAQQVVDWYVTAFDARGVHHRFGAFSHNGRRPCMGVMVGPSGDGIFVP